MDTINTTIAVVGLAAAIPTGGASLTVLTAVGFVGPRRGWLWQSDAVSQKIADGKRETI
ncbi:hypothetical protein HFP43_34885 [Streptomyces sp. SJ1-7]|nr:hypothetical protein [Streptomyces sp. SJ1-7]